MRNFLQAAPSTSGVSAGNKAVFNLSQFIGNTLENIMLTLGGTTFTKAHMTNIVLRVNGKICWETNGANQELFESFKGTPTQTDTLNLNFLEQKARTVNSFTNGGWMLDKESGVTSVVLEVDISGSAVAPTLVASVELSPATVNAGESPALARFMTRHHKANVPITAAGVKVPIFVPHGDPASGGSLFKRIGFVCNNMTYLEVIRNGVLQFQGTPSQLAAIQKKAGRVPQTGVVFYDPILDNAMQDVILNTTPQVTQSFVVNGIFSATETAVVETEELLPLNAQ